MRFIFFKAVDKLANGLLLVSLAIGRGLAAVLMRFAPLLRKQNPAKDFLFFPYTHKDNIGTLARVQEFLPLLAADGFRCDVHYIATREHSNFLFAQPHNTRWHEYRYYRRIFWQRLRWVLRAPNYKAVFVQRGLFPDYYNQRRAVLERLLHALHPNVTVDYFDADYARNETLYADIVRQADKVAVVNDFLFDRYSTLHPRVFINDLSVSAKRYQVKDSFAIHQPVRLFWTGSASNARENLTAILPMLAELNATKPLTLVMVSPTKEGFDWPFVEHHEWSEETFFDLMAGADIALYPAAADNVFSRGKVAYKTLEYAASRLPMVASPQGLSSRFKSEEDVLLATNPEEWKAQLTRMMQDETLRKRLAESAHDKFMRYHEIRANYRSLLKILNG